MGLIVIVSFISLPLTGQSVKARFGPDSSSLVFENGPLNLEEIKQYRYYSLSVYQVEKQDSVGKPKLPIQLSQNQLGYFLTNEGKLRKLARRARVRTNQIHEHQILIFTFSDQPEFPIPILQGPEFVIYSWSFSDYERTARHISRVLLQINDDQKRRIFRNRKWIAASSAQTQLSAFVISFRATIERKQLMEGIRSELTSLNQELSNLESSYFRKRFEGGFGRSELLIELNKVEDRLQEIRQQIQSDVLTENFIELDNLLGRIERLNETSSQLEYELALLDYTDWSGYEWFDPILSWFHTRESFDEPPPYSIPDPSAYYSTSIYFRNRTIYRENLPYHRIEFSSRWLRSHEFFPHLYSNGLLFTSRVIQLDESGNELTGENRYSVEIPLITISSSLMEYLDIFLFGQEGYWRFTAVIITPHKLIRSEENLSFEDARKLSGNVNEVEQPYWKDSNELNLYILVYDYKGRKGHIPEQLPILQGGKHISDLEVYQYFTSNDE